MEKEKQKIDIIIYIISALIIIIATSIGVYYIVHKEGYNFKDETDKYIININYPRTDIKEVNDNVKKIIDQEKETFIKESEQLNTETSIKSSFTSESITYQYNEIYYVYTIINISKDNNQNNIKYISTNYDNNEKKFIKMKNILNDEQSFKQLSIITKHNLKKYANEHKIKIEEKVLEQITNPKEENYEHFYFNEEGINIIYTPYQIENILEQIEITIPWGYTNLLLKDEYKSIHSDTTEEIIVPNTRNIEQYKGKKLIAFTFDDGPNEKTTKILLDNLNKYDAKVTFFVLGSRVKDNKEVIKRAYQEGNDIASHTYSHKELTTLKKDHKIMKEIEKTNKVIKDTIGVEPIYLRPPYGSINDHIRSLTNMQTVCWNVDSLDWKTKNRKKIKKKIVSNAKDGSIVLVHDIYEESVYGALMAMEELQKQGYNFVTITEMIKLKNIDLDYDKTYYGF